MSYVHIPYENYFEKALKSYEASFKINNFKDLILDDHYRNKEFMDSIKCPKTLAQEKQRKRFNM